VHRYALADFRNLNYYYHQLQRQSPACRKSQEQGEQLKAPGPWKKLGDQGELLERLPETEEEKRVLEEEEEQKRKPWWMWTAKASTGLIPREFKSPETTAAEEAKAKLVAEAEEEAEASERAPAAAGGEAAAAAAASGASGPGGSRKGHHSDEARAHLQDFWNSFGAYPVQDEREALAAKSGLTAAQVKTHFGNKRMAYAKKGLDIPGMSQSRKGWPITKKPKKTPAKMTKEERRKEGASPGSGGAPAAATEEEEAIIITARGRSSRSCTT
jgi:hypothetical protein